MWTALKLEEIGPAFEHHANFPERINTEFVQVVDATHLKMRVWERGSGETWACGTGTCATVAAMTELGICPAGEDVHVQLRGGELTIRVLPGNELLHDRRGRDRVRGYDGSVRKRAPSQSPDGDSSPEGRAFRIKRKSFPAQLKAPPSGELASSGCEMTERVELPIRQNRGKVL